MSRRTGLGRHITTSGDGIGDPLDGLVNLFDIGIVLAVAFLVAGLGLTLNSSTHKLQKRTHGSSQTQSVRSPSGAPSTKGQGEAVGTVYRLTNGQLVLVKKPKR